MTKSTNNGCLGPLLVLIIIAVLIWFIPTYVQYSDSQKALSSAREYASKGDSTVAYHKYLQYISYNDFVSREKKKYCIEAVDFIRTFYTTAPLYTYTEKYDITLGANKTTVKSNIQEWKKDAKSLWQPLSSEMDSLLNSCIRHQYQYVLQSDSIEEWDHFISQIGKLGVYDFDTLSNQRDSVKHRLDAMEQTKWRNEAYAWATACDINTVASYNKYLSFHPSGSHSGLANKRAIDLEVDSILAGEHGDLTSMDKSFSGRGSTSTVSVTNDTQYTLTLLYSGSTSKRLVLKPHSSQTITLPNGSYRIAASVNAGGVRSYAGTESLTGGGYDVSYYISTTRF